MNEAEFKPKAYFSFWFRDYVTSNARAKMNWQQRAVYIELLGHCHMDNGIPSDRRVLISKLGLAPQEEADLDAVLAEFEAHDTKAGWLMHPRTKTVLEEMAAKSAAGKVGGTRRGKSVSAKADATQSDALSPAMAAVFDKLAAAYPKSIGTVAARQVFAGYVADGTLTAENVHEVAEGFKRWKNSKQWAAEEGKYIPSLSNWLTKQRWKDHPPQATTEAKRSRTGRDPLAIYDPKA